MDDDRHVESDRRRGPDRRSDCVERDELRDWLGRHEASDRQAWDQIADELRAIRVAVEGDGERPGLRIRVDRIEQTAKLQARVIGWLGGGFFASIGGAIVAWLGRGGGQ